MKVLLTDHWMRDLDSLPRTLATKAQKLAIELTRIPRHEIAAKLTSGWRLHLLKNSPFASLSLDMNFRLLCRLDGETIVLHRIVKHDLADSSHINREATRSPSFTISDETLAIKDLFPSLCAMGLAPEILRPFSRIQSPDELLAALDRVPVNVAELAISLVESERFLYPRTKYLVLNGDEDFAQALQGDMESWMLYLHPHQEFIVRHPLNQNMIVEGGAGTGKTVCAWYRTRQIVDSDARVVFACPSKRVMSASQAYLVKLLGSSADKCLLLSGQSTNALLDGLRLAHHLVIDEGQEFPMKWYEELLQPASEGRIHLTVFLDQNQRRISPMSPGTASNVAVQHNAQLAQLFAAQKMELTLNYRNARQVAEYFVRRVNSVLPSPIKMDLPLFESGPVYERQVATETDGLALVRLLLTEILQEFTVGDVGVIVTGRPGLESRAASFLADLGITVTSDIASRGGLLVTRPHEIKGHERKAIICLLPKFTTDTKRIHRAIELYVMLSRARDRLFVVEYEQFP